MAIRLSILDQSPIYEGESATQAFQHTIELAQRAEQLGYHRFWVSEHHDSANVVGSSPEVLISHLLAKTNTIRLGSGGVMLQHYSPYKVAENFNVLAALGPDRIDLGIGRAPGGLPRSTRALQQEGGGSIEAATEYGGTGASNNAGAAPSLEDKLVELRHFLKDELPGEHPLHGLRATPVVSSPPELFVLGASVDSARMAGRLGLPYVFSLFINGDITVAEEAFCQYRASFEAASPKASHIQSQQRTHAQSHTESHTTAHSDSHTNSGAFHVRKPYVVLALSVIVANSEAEAEALAGEHMLVKIHLESGKTLTVASVEQAEEYGRQSAEPYRIEVLEPNVIRGTREVVEQRLRELHAKLAVDELVVTTATRVFAHRIRTFELLSQALRSPEEQVI
ncbi:LLM class flavin-dependent oxidoreductase [Paenibacillus sp. FSL K6-1230]|uniref:LLM class flavin-dependent oxidoreductase n=1 Tax=Paenibacillus sp. FSL K6-1230 TaxID=2921603 RepID=UPI0030FB7D02